MDSSSPSMSSSSCDSTRPAPTTIVICCGHSWCSNCGETGLLRQVYAVRWRSMWRDPTRMASEFHDVIVVGGGIHGACAAWEAARRGLTVALIEAGDFGQGTSSNSLRTLHGGLRHLQRMDFVRMRESIRARREWLHLAPHLTRPMRFLLPTSGHGVRGREVMRAALLINDL